MQQLEQEGNFTADDIDGVRQSVLHFVIDFGS